MTEELQLLVHAAVSVAAQYGGYRALRAVLEKHIDDDKAKHDDQDKRMHTLEDAHGGILR